jgi:HSP20 family molecular chaperone IbpA
MSTPLRRIPRTILPDLIDWFEDPFFVLRPYLEYTEDGRCLIKTELAGIDAEKDLDVTVGTGYVTIRAKQSGAIPGTHGTEFGYGPCSRTVALPGGIDPADVTASYRDGILTVSIGPKTAETDEAARKITVQTGE